MTDSTELDCLAEELTLRRETNDYGVIRYYNNDNQLHRVNGPATIGNDGGEFWYQDDKMHRLDGPAAIYADGTQFWYQNGIWHRLDGPALIWANGVEEWFINGIEYTEEKFNAHPLVIEYAKSKQQ